MIASVNQLRSEMSGVNPVELQNRLWDLTIDIREQLIRFKLLSLLALAAFQT